MPLEFVKLTKGSSVVSQVGGFGFFKLGVESGGGDEPSSTFSTLSWSEIANISKQISSNKLTSAQVYETYGWKLGDKRNITLSTRENIQVQIVGFNHDTYSQYGSNYIAGLTVQMVNCLATRSQMNSSTAASWYGSSLLWDLANDFKKTLPQDLQNVLKLSVRKGTSYGAAASGSTDLYMDIFPLSEKELTGTVSYAYMGNNEGTQYEYWKEHNTDEDRIKYYDADGDGIPETATNYWLRSANNGSTQYFVSVRTTGKYGYSLPTKEYGVNFAFCI
jgi:hypothetical protein